MDYFSGENASDDYQNQLNNRKIPNVIDHRRTSIARPKCTIQSVATCRFKSDVCSNAPDAAVVPQQRIYKGTYRARCDCEHSFSVFGARLGATVIGAAVLSASPISVQWSSEKSLVVSQAKAFAEVGRPLTPGSVAGVHRRVDRRAVRR